MIPFQTAYPLIFVQFFLIVAGNTGYVSQLQLEVNAEYSS